MAEVIPLTDCLLNIPGLWNAHCFLFMSSVAPPHIYGYGELLPRPSGGGVISMKEGIQICNG